MVTTCCGWLMGSREAPGVHLCACVCLAPVRCPSASPRHFARGDACMLWVHIGTSLRHAAAHSRTAHSVNTLSVIMHVRARAVPARTVTCLHFCDLFPRALCTPSASVSVRTRRSPRGVQVLSKRWSNRVFLGPQAQFSCPGIQCSQCGHGGAGSRVRRR